MFSPENFGGRVGALFINKLHVCRFVCFLSSFVSVTTGDVDENMMRSNETTNSLVLGYDIDSKNVSKKVSKSSYALLL
jgi:hypothetical protein